MKTNHSFIQLCRRRGRIMFLLLVLGLAGTIAARAATAPVVSNVTATQQAGTKLVDIYYNLTEPDSSAISISILISSDAGATCNVPAFTFTGHYGGDITPGTRKHAVWNAGADWDGQYDTDCRVRVIANDANPDDFVLIPAGSFQMGDALGDGHSNELPVHTVNVSAFYMEKSLVTGERWKAVVQGAASRGYTFTFDNPGTNKGAFHPVHTINWYDAAKWCNARSQLEGRTPCYYTDAGFTTIYRSGQVTNPYVNWSANGYRLATESLGGRRRDAKLAYEFHGIPVGEQHQPCDVVHDRDERAGGSGNKLRGDFAGCTTGRILPAA